jgi:hypothetical protein
MPLVAIIMGAILADLAFRGTEHEFAKQLGADFGQGSQFWSWAAAIAIIGALGYVDALKRPSGLLMALVVLGMVLKNGGLFQQLEAIVTHPPQAAPAVSLTSYSNPNLGLGGGGSGGGGGAASAVGTAIGVVAALA